jgi:hypothetical protein
MDSLIDINSKSYKSDVVKQVFSEDIAAYILNTLMFNQTPNDKLV